MPSLETDQLLAVFDGVDIGLIVVDDAQAVVRWNAWLAVAAGLPAEQAVGRRIDDIFPDKPMARLSGAVTAALTTGASSILTNALHAEIFPLKTRAGRRLVHNVVVSPLAGAPARCLIQITDVTVATERDRVLRERQNARYNAVVDGAPDAILTFDMKAVIQQVNPATAKAFGYPGSELVGRPAVALFEDQQAWSQAWSSLADEGRLDRPVELYARRKDGSFSYVEMSASLWHTDSRTFVTAILRDVNERRAAEAALLKLNQTLELRVAERTADRDRMWRLSSDIMLTAQLDGRINATNPAWNYLLAWTEHQLDGGNLSDFVAAEDHPKLETALSELRRSSMPRLFELRMRHLAGGERTVAWSAAASDGLLLAVGRDVSSERAAEAALRQAEDALRQSQKMEAIGQLTGGIAHDFNNLLMGIIGSLEIVRRRLDAGRSDDIEKFMNAAATSANRAAALTHRLLAFARRQPLDPQPLDVNRLVAGMDDLMRGSLSEQIQLKVLLSTDLWSAFTDANQLENALLNLVINARDAMPKGGVLTIRTENISVDAANYGQDDFEAGDYALISVSDTGVGMSPEVAAKAFDPFFTTKPIGQGTGLGLSMIYGFAKQSHGQVGIESGVGRGTTVKLYLPRHRGGPVEDPADFYAQKSPQGAGEAVLLVEDDVAVRLLIAEVLRELGYSCLEANDGQSALPILKSNVRLDLMVTDVGLPGLNGRQLAEIARQHRPDLQILFVTGYAEHATQRAGFLAPGMEMVGKPFTLEGLAVKIRGMIARTTPV